MQCPRQRTTKLNTETACLGLIKQSVYAKAMAWYLASTAETLTYLDLLEVLNVRLSQTR